MSQRKCIIISLIIGMISLEALLLTSLLTNNWLTYDDNYFGLWKHCSDGLNSSCIDIESVQVVQKDWIFAVRYTLICACGIDFLLIIVLFGFSCYLSSIKLFKGSSTIGILFLFCTELAAFIIFMIKVHGDLQGSKKEFGWSMIVFLVGLGLTLVVFVIQLVIVNCCEDCTSVVDPESELCFIEPPDSTSILMGQDITINVKVNNATNVSWYKGGQRVINIGTDYQESGPDDRGFASLTIKKTRIQYEGEYTCVAKQYCNNQSKEKIENFNLTVLPVQPIFRSKLTDVTVNAGEHIKLSVDVFPANDIAWYFDEDRLVPIRNKITATYRNNIASLTIKNAKKKNEGEYRCTAICGLTTKMEGTEVCHVTVVSELSPWFGITPKSKNVRPGDELRLELTVDGMPKPEKVRWFKEGKELRPDQDQRIVMQYIKKDSTAILIVHDTDKNDGGEYTCTAKNDHGNQVCKIDVKVEEVETKTLACAVCLENEPNKRLQCGHVFCETCINGLGEEGGNIKCPKCRQMVLPRETSNVYH